MSRTIAIVGIVAALVLQPATMRTAHAVLLRPAIMQPVSGTAVTLDDMVPGSCCCGDATQTLCMGKDGHSYVCSLKTRECMKL